MKRIFSNKINSKISVKLFAITALTFTALLICAMLAQAYYFNHTYIVYQVNDPNKYTDMAGELNKSDMSAKTAAKILNKYKNKYEIEAAVFLSDRTTLKFQPEELSDYPFSPILMEGISYYLSDISPFLEEHDNLFTQQYPAADGHIYSMMASTHLNGGEVLFAVFPMAMPKTPGLIDRYYIYVLIAGVLASVLLSYIFSLIVSRPLVNINRIANEMAGLSFGKKIEHSGGDELGQLSKSLNLMSEKLDSALKELTEANIKLESDIEKEREMEKARKEFVANASHELKTPLAIIKGYGSALSDNVREDKREHYINQIIRQADAMSKLVEDMLELSRIEGGRYELHITSFDLAMLTQSIIESLRFLAEEKNLHIIQEYSGPEIIIQADRMKISQVISNFIHNAIRFTPRNGNIFIRISENEECVRFETENEGAGISPDKLEKVWDKFYREEEARNKKTGGTGLGLAICEKILQAHQLGYGAENTGRGAMFYFIVSSHPIDR